MLTKNNKITSYFKPLLIIFASVLIVLGCASDTATRAHQSNEFRGEVIRPASLESKNSMIQTAIFEYISKIGYGKTVQDVNARVMFSDMDDIIRRFTVTAEDGVDTSKKTGDAGMGSSNSRIHLVFAWDSDKPLPSNARYGSLDSSLVISSDIDTAHPEIKTLLDNWDFSEAPLPKLEEKARKFREQADRWIAYNEVAIYFLLRNEPIWTKWVSTEAKTKLDTELSKEQGMAAQQKD
jgi:ABC-type proline/glycine betaine transport system substrate-binding protein